MISLLMLISYIFGGFVTFMIMYNPSSSTPFQDIDTNARHDFRTYCVYESVSNNSEFPMKQIATGIQYTEALTLYNKKREKRVIYSDIIQKFDKRA